MTTGPTSPSSPSSSSSCSSSSVSPTGRSAKKKCEIFTIISYIQACSYAWSSDSCVWSLVWPLIRTLLSLIILCSFIFIIKLVSIWLTLESLHNSFNGWMCTMLLRIFMILIGCKRIKRKRSSRRWQLLSRPWAWVESTMIIQVEVHITLLTKIKATKTKCWCDQIYEIAMKSCRTPRRLKHMVYSTCFSSSSSIFASVLAFCMCNGLVAQLRHVQLTERSRN